MNLAISTLAIPLYVNFAPYSQEKRFEAGTAASIRTESREQQPTMTFTVDVERSSPHETALDWLSWPAIDAEFREALDKVTLPLAALAYVDSKFERPSVWARPCPHVVDALKHGGDVCRDAHDLVGARDAYGKALARDTHDWPVSFSLATMELKEGDASSYGQLSTAATG